MKEEALKKCKQCNAEPEVKTIHGDLDFYVVRCPMCGQFVTNYDKGEVLYEWNLRNRKIQ